MTKTKIGTYLVPMLLLGLVSCDIHHPDTKKILDEIKQQEPRRIMPGEILNFTRDRGRVQMSQLEKILEEKGWNGARLSQSRLDSLAASLDSAQVTLRFITEGSQQTLDPLSEKVFVAYAASEETQATDNVQLLNGDNSILYSQPAFENGVFYGMWSLNYHKPDIVILIPETE